MTKSTNLAFIDGQNLHLGTRSGGWTIDFVKLREYLSDVLHVTEAYYFLGVIDTEEQELYTMLQKAGFIVIFREHYASMTGDKKGNVDTDLVFEVLKSVIDRQDRDQAVLVSGDGDYIKLVKYLIKHNRLAKILFPNPKHSSLYNQIDEQYIEDLSDKTIKSTIRLGGTTKRTQPTSQSTPTQESKKENKNNKNTKDKPKPEPIQETKTDNKPQSSKPNEPKQSSSSQTSTDTKPKSRRRRSSRKKTKDPSP